jgi:hypothetical protein
MVLKHKRHNNRDTGFRRIRACGHVKPNLDLVSLRRECVIEESLLLEVRLLEDMLAVPRNFLGQRIESQPTRVRSKKLKKTKVS